MVNGWRRSIAQHPGHQWPKMDVDALGADMAQQLRLQRWTDLTERLANNLRIRLTAAIVNFVIV